MNMQDSEYVRVLLRLSGTDYTFSITANCGDTLRKKTVFFSRRHLKTHIRPKLKEQKLLKVELTLN